MVKSVKPLDHALGIVEAIDADDKDPTAQARSHVLRQWRSHIAARQPLECPRIDADREMPDPGLPSVQAQGRLVAVDLEDAQLPRLIALRDQIAHEIARVAS